MSTRHPIVGTDHPITQSQHVPTSNPPIPRDLVFRAGWRILVIVGIVILFRTTPLRIFTSLDQIVAWVEIARADPALRWGYFLVFPFVILAIPIAIFPIIGGILFPFWIAFPLNMAAILTGAIIAYWIGRLLGRDVIAPLLGAKAGSFRQFQAEKGFRTVLLIRWIGLPPFLITNYAFGFTGFGFSHYLAGTAIGVFPWTGITTYMAGSLWDAVLAGHQGGIQAAASLFLREAFWVFGGFLLVVILVSRKLKRPKPLAPQDANR